MSRKTMLPLRSLNVMQRIALSAAVLLLAGSAQAAISFTKVTWETDADTNGWYTETIDIGTGLPTGSAVSTSSRPTTGGNPDGFLEMTFPVDSLGSPYEMLGTATGGFDLTQNELFVTFDWKEDFPNANVADRFLYLFSTYNGGSGWAHNLSTGSGWVSQYVDFNSGWTQIGNTTPVNFADALANVTLFGVVVQPILAGSEMVFGLDNLQFAVPEPGEWAMILTVLGSVIFSMRRYRRAA